MLSIFTQDFCNDSIERLNATLGVYTTRRTRPPIRTTLPTRPPQRTTKPTTTAQPDDNNIGMWEKFIYLWGAEPSTCNKNMY